MLLSTFAAASFRFIERNSSAVDVLSRHCDKAVAVGALGGCLTDRNVADGYYGSADFTTRNDWLQVRSGDDYVDLIGVEYIRDSGTHVLQGSCLQFACWLA